MRKIFISSVFFSLVFLFQFSPVVLAGPQCDALGGRCRIACLSTEDDKGTQAPDCPSGTGGPVSSQTCCVPKPTPAGSQCGPLGGICVPVCTAGDPKGTLDCPQLFVGGLLREQTCCVYTSSTGPSDLTSQLPGIGCGVPNDTKGADKCCSPVVINCSFGLLDALQIVPGVGSLIYEAKARCESIGEFQKKYPALKCLSGEEKYDSSGNCSCTFTATSSAVPEIREMCLKYLNKSGPAELKGCLDCSAYGFWTGIGCIPLTLEGFIGLLFTFGIGLGGLIALFCIIYSAFVMQTSSGNPERIKKAQENLTSCIMGLMLILFSIFILRLIGVDILKIPGIGIK